MTNDELLQKVEALIRTIEEMPDHILVSFDPTLRDDAEWVLEPVTVSCDNMTIIGYVVTNKQVMH